MRKLLSFCAALICAATMYAENMALYFVPNSDWATTGGAKYAAWYFDGSGADGFSAFMTLVPGETNLYTTEIPTGYASVIIARINGAAAEPNWSDKWNQTANLTIPAGKNCFTQAAGWDDMSGTWSTYVAWSEIAFTEAIAAGNFDNKVFAVADSSFKFVCSDATNKMSIDANNATFGTAAGNTKYSYRLKSGGKSGATNYMTFTIPANGTFRFAARPAGTGDRSVVLTQGENELFNQVITDTKNDDNYYDYKSVAVAAGSLTVTYSNGMNFYSFAFVANDNEPETPAVVTKDLKFVPGVWKEANAVLAAWTWGAQAAGAWSTFAGSGDTLIAKINEKADSVIFVRFEAGAAIDWNSTVWNRKEDAINACGVFIVNAWDNYSWCTVPAPEVPCEGKFGFMVDSLYVPALRNAAQEQWVEYFIDSLDLKAGQKLNLFDSCAQAGWISAVAYADEAYAFEIDTVAHKWVVKEAGTYALYIKMIPNADELYVINKSHVAPEPCEGKFGFMVDSLYVPALRNAAQEQWVEYFIDSLDLKAGQKLCLFDSCAQAGWISAVAYADEAYAFEIDTVAHKWVVKEAGTYALYIKMIPNADELYVINKSHVAPEPCEGKFGFMVDSLYVPAIRNAAQEQWVEYFIDSLDLKAGQKLNLFDSCAQAGWISAVAYADEAYAFEIDTVAHKWVVKEAGTYALYIKMIPNADELYVINKSHVAPEPCEGKFGFMVDSLYVPALRNAAQEQWVEYFIDSLDLKAGQKLNLFDSCAQAGWISAVAYADEAYAFEIDTVAHKWVVKEAGTYALYIKMIPNADELYVINKSHVAPEPCEGKFGFMVDSLYVPALRNAAQEQWVEYFIDSLDLKAGQKLNLFDSCAQAGWISAVAYADEAYAFEIDTVAHKWVVKEAGTYALYIKMIPNADELYVINKSHVAPEPCEGKFGFMVDSLYVPALRNAAQEQWVEYFIDSLDLKAGQTLNLFDSCAQAGWISAVAYADEAYAFEIDTVAHKWVVKEAGTYALYIKMIPNADELYVINKSHVAPEPCEGKFGFMVDSLYVPALRNAAQEQWVEYFIDSLDLKAGQTLNLFDSCAQAGWISAVAYADEAYAFEIDTVAHKWVVKEAGTYALYIKMIPNADELYVINKSHVAPEPCEGKFGFMIDSLYVPAIRNAAQEQWVEYFIDSLDLKAGQKLNLFDSCAQAGWISAVAYADEAYAFEIDTVAHKWVVKEAGTYALYIKMIPNADELYVINKSHVAPEPCEGKFGFMIDSLYVPAIRNAAQEQWVEYFIDSLDLKAGQKLNLFDSCAQAGWISAVAYADEAYAFEIDTVAHKWVVKEAGTYALYIKMIPNADELYVINKSHVAPEPCEGKFGFMVDSLYVPALRNAAQEQWVEYFIDSLDLKAGQKLNLFDSCAQAGWISAVAYADEAYAFEIDTVAHKWVVKEAGTYALYIKMIPNADELYVINKSHVAPEPCEGKFGFMVDSLYVPAIRNAAQEQWVEYFIDSLDLKAGQKLNLFDSCAQAGWTSAVAYADEAYAFEIDTVAHKWVVKEAGTYALYIKMIPNADELYVINKSHVAPEPCEGKFGFMVDSLYVPAIRNAAQEQWVEYFIDSLDLKAGQKLCLFDSCAQAGWISAVAYADEAYAFEIDTVAHKWVVKEAGTYALYIKMIPNADELYVINKSHVAPEPCEGKFGIMLNGQYVAAARNEMQTEYLEYMILGIDLAAGQHFQIYDSCNAAGWIIATPGYGNVAYAFNVDAQAQMYEVTMAGSYDLYIKMIQGADELYVINKDYVEPEPCEGKFGIMLNGQYIAATLNTEAAVVEYMILGQPLTAGQHFQLYDSCNAAGWIMTPAYQNDAYAFRIDTENQMYEVTMDGNYDLYVKLVMGADELYVINQSYNPEPPTPCEGEFGIMVNGTKFVAGEKNEGQTAYLEYTIQSNLYENETLVIYDNCNQAGFLATQEEGGYWFTLNAAQDAFIVPQDGAYTIYLKMYGPGNNVIYTVNNSGSGLEETLYNDGQLHKVVEDGIIVIYRDGKRYNLQGQALR